MTVRQDEDVAWTLARHVVKVEYDDLPSEAVEATKKSILDTGIESDIGGMRDAFPNQAGVLAALMAQRGIRGVRTCFEGKAGFYNVYFGGKYDRSALTADLGKCFHGAEVGYKPWPASGTLLLLIDLAIGLAREHDLQPAQIDKVTAYVSEYARNHCEPREARVRPATTMDAKFSVPFGIAIAIARRRVLIADYAVENLRDPVVLALAEKVIPSYSEDYHPTRTRRPAKVEIHTRDGKVFAASTDYPLGHPKRPMSWDDLTAKFRDCLSHAVKPVPEANIDSVIDMVRRLEDIEDVDEIIRLLA
ncbi:MAG: MmgE/PrpD family protein [Chloroflexi bacterium]|nr:MmgE/PrpD family protein [Chloroflexota bacterium]